MKAPFVDELNELLTSVYQSLERMEEQMLLSNQKLDLSIHEIHFLEAVGNVAADSAGKTVSDLAAELGIKPPSVTAAANKLARKGFLTKERNPSDGRVVHLKLTREGRKMYRVHSLFHYSMARTVAETLEPEERDAMLKGIRKLRDFFDQKLED